MDFEEIEQQQKTKKLNMKKLIQKLSPETLEKIRQLSPETDTKVVVNLLIPEAFGAADTNNILEVCRGTVEQFVFGQLRSSELDPAIINVKELAIKVDALAAYTIPGQGPQLDQLRIEFAGGVCRGSAEKFAPQLAEMGPGDTSRAVLDDENLQFGYDRACDELWPKIIRKCYRGKKKDFQEKVAAVYRVPPETFQPFLRELFQKALDDHPFKVAWKCLPQLYKIAEQIRKGEHINNPTTTCWECGISAPHDDDDDDDDDCLQLRPCSMCLTSLYCGITCQTKAWKYSGHQYSCPSLKKIRENHQTNLDVVRRASGNPDEHEHRYGYRPNSRIDYFLAWNPFQCLPVVEEGGEQQCRQSGGGGGRDCKEDEVQGFNGWRIKLPSMESFYSNLSQVKNGQLWSDYPGVAPDVASAAPLVDSDDDGLLHITCNGLALSHDYYFSESSCSEEDEVGPAVDSETAILGENDNVNHNELLFQKRNAEFHSNVSSGHIFINSPMPSSNCTAAVFLKSYLKWKQDPKYTGIFRERARLQAFGRMQEYDRRIGHAGVERKRLKKVVKRKGKMLRELRQVLYQRKVEHLEEVKKELEESYKNIVVLEESYKNIVVAKKELLHMELKRGYQVNETMARKKLVTSELEYRFQVICTVSQMKLVHLELEKVFQGKAQPLVGET